MRWTYSCPRCGAHLNPSGSAVVLLGRFEGKRGLMVFAAEPGSYGISVPRDMEVSPGQVWDFLCAVCGEDLVVEEGEEMVRLLCHCEDKGEHSVFFSRKAGIHATFVFDSEGTPVASHGTDKGLYESLAWMKWW